MKAKVPSFKQGLPVSIEFWDKTVIIGKSRVRIQYCGLWSLFRENLVLPISDFKAIQLSGTYFVDDVREGVVVWIELIHRSNFRNNVLLAEGDCNKLQFKDSQLMSFRELLEDAANVLSLPQTIKWKNR